MLRKFTSAFLAFMLTLSVMAVATVNAGAASATTYQAEKVCSGYVTKEVTNSQDSYGNTSTATTSYIYNSNGNLTKRVYKDSEDYTSTSTEIYSYNSKGNLIKYKEGDDVTTYTYNSKGNLIKNVCNSFYVSSTTIYTYNSKGNLIKNVCNGKDCSIDFTSSTTYTYNSKGNLTKKIYKDINYYSTITQTYTYNSNGLLTKNVDSREDSDGNTSTETTTLTYNSIGNLTKKVYKGSNGDTSTRTYTYNSKGNLTKEVYKSSSGYAETRTYTYNSKGNLTKEVYAIKYSSGYTYTGTTNYTYNTKGNLTKEVYAAKYNDGDTETSTTAYTYNSKGNLIKEFETSNSSDFGASAKTKTYTYSGYDKNTYSYNGYTFIIDNSVTLTDKSARPEITVLGNNDGPMIKGVGYTLSYSDNTKAGTGKVLVKLIGENVTVEVPFTILPAQVKSLKATTVSTNSITLSWNKVTGATYYKIEKSLDGKTWDEVKTFKANKLTVYSLKAGTKYQFRVTALDASKEIAGKTSVVLKTGTLTTAPTITIESTKSNTATVKIEKVKGATKYNVYLSTDGETLTKVATTTGTTATLSDLTGGQRIYVRVRAVNAYGKTSEYSNVAKVNVKK